VTLRSQSLCKAALLALATEVVFGLVPLLIIQRTHMSAEEAAPVFITHIPGLLVASPLLFWIENPRNASVVEPLGLGLAITAQVMFWGWLWWLFLVRRSSRRSDLGRVDP